MDDCVFFDSKTINSLMLGSVSSIFLNGMTDDRQVTSIK